MENKLAYTLISDKPFKTVVENIEKQAADHKFRVLARHDVQATLAEKGFERGPLYIIEVCNAGFAHKALQYEELISLFMPCRYSVFTRDNKTVVNLARPSLMTEMMPVEGLAELAGEVEKSLKSIMEKAV
ncbi:MAG: DUF302 domain-containing protein [Candidatus Zixiibacteriota bacterium]